MSRILIGSPIRLKNTILQEFLQGLDEVDKSDHKVEFYFVDDNVDKKSTELLQEFAKRNKSILRAGAELFQTDDQYANHGWKPETLAKVTCYKNTIIQYCIDEEYDYLLLIDSDIILDKRALLQLISDDVDIVSNVFWNQWKKNGRLTPQCFWIPDIYLQESAWNTPRSFEESHKIRMETYEKMKIPGLYRVDGTGACTLIKRRALVAGVNFTEIPNLKILGEDRPFCIRAGVLGFDLYMDTHYPAYHCSREIFLDRVEEFKRDGWKFDMCCTYEEKPKKKFNTIRKAILAVGKFIDRVGKKIIRDFSD